MTLAPFIPFHPVVNFTNILWAAFVPKSFCQKITNPNFKHIKAAQRALVWLSILPIFNEQLFHTKVLYAALMCLQFGFLIFWRKDFGAKAAHKMLVKLASGVNFINIFGEKRTAKSAKSPVNCKKIELCVQKLELFVEKQLFCHSRA